VAIQAGKNAKILCTGSALTLTAQATTSSDNKTYQINDTAKRILDLTATITVKDGGSDTVESYSLNRLNGSATFATTATRTITIEGTYLPTTEMGYAYDYSYSIEADNVDITDFGSSFIERKQALLDFSCSLSNWYINDAYKGLLTAGVPIVLEFYTDDSSTFDLKAWVLPASNEVSDSVDGVIEESLEFEGTTDADNRSITVV
jgi:hypothetical protein